MVMVLSLNLNFSKSNPCRKSSFDGMVVKIDLKTFDLPLNDSLKLDTQMVEVSKVEARTLSGT